jgi:hypothetical protein
LVRKSTMLDRFEAMSGSAVVINASGVRRLSHDRGEERIEIVRPSKGVGLQPDPERLRPALGLAQGQHAAVVLGVVAHGLKEGPTVQHGGAMIAYAPADEPRGGRSMKRFVAFIVLSGIVLTSGGKALAQGFSQTVCVQVGPPVGTTLQLVVQPYPFSVFPNNAFAVVGTRSTGSLTPVYGSGFLLSGEGVTAAHFALTIGPDYVQEAPPAMWLRGFVRFEDGAGHGVCQQRAGDVPCGEKASVTFRLCP